MNNLWQITRQITCLTGNYMFNLCINGKLTAIDKNLFPSFLRGVGGILTRFFSHIPLVLYMND